jgi:HEAT repeat protein
MDDEYWQVRVKAARSLGLIKSPTGVSALAGALTHDISNLRKEAAAALGEIAHADALPYLEAVLDDPDPDVRKNVVWAINRIKAA